MDSWGLRSQLMTEKLTPSELRNRFGPILVKDTQLVPFAGPLGKVVQILLPLERQVPFSDPRTYLADTCPLVR